MMTYQELKDQDVGVVGMVMDTVGDDGKTDEEVVKTERDHNRPFRKFK